MLDKTNFYKNLGKNINKFRIEKDYSINQFNSVSGLDLDRSTIWGIENGKQQISVYQLYLISKSLDKSLNDIVQDGKAEEENIHLLDKDDIEEIESY